MFTMKKIPSFLIASSCCLTLLVGVAEANPGKGKGKGNGKSPHAENGKGNKGKPDKVEKAIAKEEKQAAKDWEKGKAPKFKDTERSRVLGYFETYRDQEFGLPPGLAKNLRRGKPLPPGWQAKLAPGAVIAADWLPDFSPVPYDWFPGVEVIPDTRLYWYGDRIVRVYEPRHEIVDVIVVPTIHVGW